MKDKTAGVVEPGPTEPPIDARELDVDSYREYLVAHGMTLPLEAQPRPPVARRIDPRVSERAARNRAEEKKREDERFAALPTVDGCAADPGEVRDRLRALGLDPTGLEFSPKPREPTERERMAAASSEYKARHREEVARRRVTASVFDAGKAGGSVDARQFGRAELSAFLRARGLVG